MNLTPTAAAAESWLLRTRRDQAIHVPNRISSLTTYVMLEQEQWFETEIDFICRLLEPGTDMLDIGANHGVYTLAGAQAMGAEAGRVWSFEPTSEPRTRLERTIQANALGERVSVIACALSDHVGRAHFHTSAQSELNSLSAVGGTQQEEVRLDTLDAFAERHLAGRAVSFVKIDAEGEELRVLRGGRSWFERSSAVVMFELMHGAHPQLELLAEFRALGYGIFRHLPDTDLLLEYEPDRNTPEGWVLNLFAIKPAQQARLAELGLLVRRAELGDQAEVLEPHELAIAKLAACAPLRGLDLPFAEGDSPEYVMALAHAATAQLGLVADAAQRLRHLRAARDGVRQALEAGRVGDIAAWSLLVHCLHALGERSAALNIADQVLRGWPEQAVQRTIFMPALAGDLDRRRSSDAASWMRQTLAEFVEVRRRHSSFFGQTVPGSLEALLRHPDHSVEMERRYFLGELRHDRLPEQTLLVRLPEAGATKNGAIWSAWLEQLRVEALQERPLDVLLPLLDRPVAIVDVGASTHGRGTEPYASLLLTGRAQVTGFEPDEQALAELQRVYPADGRHRFLPHLVADGADAVFHRTTWFMTSSLLAPDAQVLNAYQNLGEVTRETGSTPVSTVRLDDVIERGGMDLLKIDVQGAEGRVFDGAAELLRECLVVWTEVEFVPLYRGQPLFGDIYRQLAAAGLRFFSFSGFGQRLLAGWPEKQVRPGQRMQQLWADAIFVPTPQRMAQMDKGSLARLALLCHEVLDAPDLCHEALVLYARGSVDEGRLAARYAQAMRAGAAAT